VNKVLDNVVLLVGFVAAVAAVALGMWLLNVEPFVR
jgi:hypothetical protein